MIAKEKMFLVKETEKETPLHEVGEMMADMELILTEGFGRETHAVIEVLGGDANRDSKPIGDKVIAVVTEHPADFGVKKIEPTDYVELCDFIENRFLQT